jgi:hypothetical protein
MLEIDLKVQGAKPKWGNVFDALPSSLVDPLEGLTRWKMQKELELGAAPDF